MIKQNTIHIGDWKRNVGRFVHVNDLRTFVTCPDVQFIERILNEFNGATARELDGEFKKFGYRAYEIVGT